MRGPAPSCAVVGRFSVRGHRGTNRVRFKGRIGRRTLEPGTYTLAAHPAGRPQQTRHIVVVVGGSAREQLDCSNPTESAFAGAVPFFDGGDAGRTTATAPRAEKEKRSRGVLPAITKKLRELPRALPRPPVPGEASSPPTFIGLIALGLLALSGIAILGYVIRFLHHPGSRSA